MRIFSKCKSCSGQLQRYVHDDIDWCDLCSISYKGSTKSIQWQKLRPDAVIPTKAHDTDAGWDLTVLEKVKTFAGICDLYDTGLAIRPPPGYYTEIVARSSISKTGHIIANGIGIIDEGYSDSLKVALIRLTEGEPGPIKLPCKIAQLIFRKREDLYLEAVEVDSLDETPRGTGGFGSSG